MNTKTRFFTVQVRKKDMIQNIDAMSQGLFLKSLSPSVVSPGSFTSPSSLLSGDTIQTPHRKNVRTKNILI